MWSGSSYKAEAAAFSLGLSVLLALLPELIGSMPTWLGWVSLVLALAVMMIAAISIAYDRFFGEGRYISLSDFGYRILQRLDIEHRRRLGSMLHSDDRLTTAGLSNYLVLFETPERPDFFGRVEIGAALEKIPEQDFDQMVCVSGGSLFERINNHLLWEDLHVKRSEVGRIVRTLKNYGSALRTPEVSGPRIREL
ncbi:MAG: hypothetical protein GVY06_08000 [Alphaproteobacteria bacterium]|jgi:hypothetical protein|nr:hypothetical protein [Alphaproteobacteria bacterium]